MANRETRWLRKLEEDKERYHNRHELKNNKRQRKPRPAYDEVDEDFAALAGRQSKRRRKSLAVDPTPDPVETEQGLVVWVGGGLCQVELAQQELLCSIRRALELEQGDYANVVAVGDRVLVSQSNAEQGVIEAVLPRSSMLIRPDVGQRHLSQVLVANIHQVLVVASWRNPHWWPELIDRYLIAAARNDLTPVICLNKVDLADDPTDYESALQPYRDLDYTLIFTSTVTGQGLAQLNALLHQQTTVLAGLSGVGKSSLVKSVQADFDLRVGQVNEDKGQGRHTTTQATWFKLDGGGAIIDTPGIREFGLVGLDPAALGYFYPEIAAHAHECRFKNCTHRHEPDCAVKVAVERAQISTVRYENYLKIYESLGV